MKSEVILLLFVLVVGVILFDLCLGLIYRVKYKKKNLNVDTSINATIFNLFGIGVNTLAIIFAIMLLTTGTKAINNTNKNIASIPKNTTELNLVAKNNGAYIYKDKSGKEYNLILDKDTAKDKIYACSIVK